MSMEVLYKVRVDRLRLRYSQMPRLPNYTVELMTKDGDPVDEADG